MRHPHRALAALCCALALAPAAGASPDWEAVRDVQHVWVLSTDEDGDARETKVWLAVVDGQGFIRTSGSTWGENLTRNPELVLRIEGHEYPLRADFIEGDAFRARIEAAFREKYGWSDAFIGLMRFGRPKIMHMAPR